MTDQEKNIIKNEIIDEISLQSKTIEDLTEAKTVSASDLVELNRGRKASFGVLKKFFSQSNSDLLLEDLFEKVNIGTVSVPVWAISAKFGLYTNEFLSAHGLNPFGNGSTGYIRLDEWSDYDEDKTGWVLSAFLGHELHTRLVTLEGKNYLDSLDVLQKGTGNAVTDVSISADKKKITVTKGATFLTQHQDISGLLSKTEAASLYQPKGNYLTQHQDISGLLSKTEAASLYQPKGNYLTQHQSLADYLKIDGSNGRLPV